jgi:hypothetical protein
MNKGIHQLQEGGKPLAPTAGRRPASGRTLLPVFRAPVSTVGMVAGLLLLALPARSAEVAHGSLFDTTARTLTNNTWAEVTQYAVSATNFVPGNKYLIVARIGFNGNNNGSLFGFQAYHGTNFSTATAFTDSRFILEPDRTAAVYGDGFNWFTVWTAVSNENLHFGAQAAVTRTAQFQDFAVMWISLTNGLVENSDWYYTASTHSGDATNAYWTNGASCTFDGGSNAWLILAHTHWTIDSTANRYQMRINFNGTGYSEAMYEEENASEESTRVAMYVVTNWTGSKTVRTEYKTDSATTPADCTDTKIFALKLNAFADYFGNYNTGTFSLTPVDTWVSVNSNTTYTASRTGDVAIFAFDVARSAGRSSQQHHIKVDSVGVSPSNKCVALPQSTNGLYGLFSVYMGSLNQGTRSIVVDAMEAVTITPTVTPHSMAIFSMRLYVPYPTFTNLTASTSVTYGTTSLTLTGIVSAAGPVYPTNGENVIVTINGNAQTTTVSGATGGFSINYNPATIPASTNPYTITYYYPGSEALRSASNTSRTLTVGKATATIVFYDTNQVYNGSARVVTNTTVPAGLTVSNTYNGSYSAPTNAGSYAVTGVVYDANYQGTNVTTLVITKATATIAFYDTNQVYNGSARVVTNTTVPAGLTVSNTYNGSYSAPTNVGTYAVTGVVYNAN